MRLYAAVYFINTNDTEAVPLSWLRSNEEETLCSWPPFTSATKIMAAISTRAAPGPDWKEYEANIIRKCGSFYLLLYVACCCCYI